MQRPLRPCKAPGCTELVPYGYCSKHKPAHQRYASSKWHHLYQDKRWYRLRREHLLTEPFCRECTKAGRIDPTTGRTPIATEVDHIVPHRGDMRLFLDGNNLQSLCHRCHSRKTVAENAEIFGSKNSKTR